MPNSHIRQRQTHPLPTFCNGTFPLQDWLNSVSWVLEEVERTWYSIQPLQQKFPKLSKPNHCILSPTLKKKKKTTFMYFIFVNIIFHLPTGAFCTCCCWFLGGCSRTTCFRRALWRCLVQPPAQISSSELRLHGDLSSQVWASPRTELLQLGSVFEYAYFNSVTISIKKKNPTSEQTTPQQATH